MNNRETREAVTPVLERIKRESFVNAGETADEDAMGLLVSKFFEWDGLAILKTAYSALEDANFHAENETIEELIRKVERDYQ